MSDQELPKRRGRPPKYAGEGKRQNFSFRIRDAMRDRLIEVVKNTGRSLSEEIEHRIDLSFEAEYLFGSPSGIELLKQISIIANLEMERTGKNWQSDQTTRDAIQHHIDLFFKSYAAREAAHAKMARHLTNAWKDLGPGPQLAVVFDEAPGPASPGTSDLETVIKRAVAAALRETLMPSLTNQFSQGGSPEPSA